MREIGGKQFRYTFDPICVGSMVIYAIGRWYLRPHHIGGAFTKDYLNDVLCLPLFTPIILHVQTFLGLREHDLPPRLWEILQHWIVFSVIFEGIIPHFPRIWRSVADPWDVVAYLVGGLGATILWKFLYWKKSAEESTNVGSLASESKITSVTSVSDK